jgi:hypothetical protein
MDAHQLLEGDAAKGERVAVSQVGRFGEGEAPEIVEGRDVVGLDPGLVEAPPVEVGAP